MRVSQEPEYHGHNNNSGGRGVRTRRGNNNRKISNNMEIACK